MFVKPDLNIAVAADGVTPQRNWFPVVVQVIVGVTPRRNWFPFVVQVIVGVTPRRNWFPYVVT